MRTTLTLDDDVAKAIENEVRVTGSSLKETVNRLLRRGLAGELAGAEPEPRFVVHARDLGVFPGLNYDDIGALLEQVEGANYR